MTHPRSFKHEKRRSPGGAVSPPVFSTFMLLAFLGIEGRLEAQEATISTKDLRRTVAALDRGVSSRKQKKAPKARRSSVDGTAARARKRKFRSRRPKRKARPPLSARLRRLIWEKRIYRIKSLDELLGN